MCHGVTVAAGLPRGIKALILTICLLLRRMLECKSIQLQRGCECIKTLILPIVLLLWRMLECKSILLQRGFERIKT